MEEKVIGLAKGTQRDSTSQVSSPKSATVTPAANPVSETSTLVLIQFLFGFSYVSSKVMVSVLPAMVWVCLRTWLTALGVSLLAFVLRGKPPRVSRGDWLPLMGLGFVGASFNQITFLLGLQRTTAANSAVLSCLIPVFTLLFSILLRREKWSLRIGVSFAFAFLGSLIVVDITNYSLAATSMVGDVLVIFNALSYGAFLAFGGDFLRRYDRLWATAYLFFVGSFYVGIFSIPEWQVVTWPAFDGWLWSHAVYAVLGAVLIPYILINSVLVRVAPSKVAVFVFLQPVVAGISGWFILGTPLTIRWAVGSVLVFGGVILSYLGSFRAAARNISVTHKDAIFKE